MADKTNAFDFELEAPNTQSLPKLDIVEPSESGLDGANKTSLGREVTIAHGDTWHRTTGSVPTGYIPRPYFSEYHHNSDARGWLSWGPLYRPSGIGAMARVAWYIEILDRGPDDELAFTVYCRDRNNGLDILAQRSWSNAMLPSTSSGVIVSTVREFEINPSMHIVMALYANGGASIRHHFTRFERDYL